MATRDRARGRGAVRRCGRPRSGYPRSWPPAHPGEHRHLFGAIRHDGRLRPPQRQRHQAGVHQIEPGEQGCDRPRCGWVVTSGEGRPYGVQKGPGGFVNVCGLLHDAEQAVVVVDVGAGGEGRGGGPHADGDELVVLEGESGQRDLAHPPVQRDDAEVDVLAMGQVQQVVDLFDHHLVVAQALPDGGLRQHEGEAFGAIVQDPLPCVQGVQTAFQLGSGQGQCVDGASVARGLCQPGDGTALESYGLLEICADHILTIRTAKDLFIAQRRGQVRRGPRT